MVVGLLATGFGVVSHGLHAVNSGLDRYDLTGIGMIAGGLLLVAAGVTAVAAPRRAPRRAAHWRLAHGALWLVGAFVMANVVVMPLVGGLMVTHAPRWEIQESSLGIPHEEVRIDSSGGRTVSAWYVPSRNGAAVLVGHGSGGSRERVLEEIRLLAKHGYGVLAFDLHGNGESSGHSNGLGDNAQPAVDAALDYLEPARRPDRRVRVLARRRGAARGGRARRAHRGRRGGRRRAPRGPDRGQWRQRAPQARRWRCRASSAASAPRRRSST